MPLSNTTFAVFAAFYATLALFLISAAPVGAALYTVFAAACVIKSFTPKTSSDTRVRSPFGYAR